MVPSAASHDGGMKVARSEVTVSTPILAKSAVSAANAAERSAQASQLPVMVPRLSRERGRVKDEVSSPWRRRGDLGLLVVLLLLLLLLHPPRLRLRLPLDLVGLRLEILAEQPKMTRRFELEPPARKT